MTSQHHESMKTLISGLNIMRYQGLLKTRLDETERQSIQTLLRPRQSRPSDGGQCSGGGGCIACDRNEEEECVSACSHAADERCEVAERRTGLARLGWRKLGAAAPQQMPVLAASTSLGSNVFPPKFSRNRSACAASAKQ